MQHLPLFADLSRRYCLVVGGGSVAERKVAMLRRAAPNIVLVAPDLTPQLKLWAQEPGLTWLPRLFAVDDVAGKHLVIAATADPQVNQAVADAAEGAGCLVNVVDQPAMSNFISPAIVDRSPLIIAISSGGAMPVLARRIRAWLENLLPQGIGRLAAAARAWRPSVASRFPDLIRRRHFWEQVLDKALLSGKSDEQLITQTLAQPERTSGAVYLVGAGPGDPDLLTLKAARILQQADVILYDRLVAPEILERARRDAQFINVGKKAGAHRFSQAQINRLLIEHAKQGQMVCRLKGGDPGLFGRAGEELRAVRDAGIEVELVPGITAVQGCAAAAGFSLTDRQHAHSVVLATAHLATDDHQQLVQPDEQQTAAYYMPIASLPDLQRQLLARGLPATTPCALIENGTRPQQRVIRANLRYIHATAEKAQVASPALLVVGQVVADMDPAAVTAESLGSASVDAVHRALNAA